MAAARSLSAFDETPCREGIISNGEAAEICHASRSPIVTLQKATRPSRCLLKPLRKTGLLRALEAPFAGKPSRCPNGSVVASAHRKDEASPVFPLFVLVWPQDC